VDSTVHETLGRRVAIAVGATTQYRARLTNELRVGYHVFGLNIRPTVLYAEGGRRTALTWRFTLYEVVMESRSSATRRALMDRLLEPLHSGAHEGKSEAVTVTSANVDVESMDAFEVLFQLCKSEGLVVAGDPTQAFAHVDSITGMLHVYARDKDAVEISSNATKTMLAALEVVLKEGASFSSSSDTAVCVLGDVTARGYTYGEAALRVLAKRQINRSQR